MQATYSRNSVTGHHVLHLFSESWHDSGLGACMAATPRFVTMQQCQ